MPYLPYKKLVLDSPFTVDQATIALRSNLETDLSKFSTDKPFRGSFDGTSFECMQALVWWSKAEPYIVGRFEPLEGGNARIHISFRLNYIALFTLSLPPILFGLMILLVAPSETPWSTFAVAEFFSIVVVLIALLFLSLGWNYHYRNSRDRFMHIFNIPDDGRPG